MNNLLFSTVRIAKEGRIATHDEDDPYITAAPFYFVWNQPFKACWEIGFIQGMDAAKAELEEREKIAKAIENKKWRGIYSYFSTALKAPAALFNIQQLGILVNSI
jgi:hypothetical protein